jgi:formylmethanofuran dehydrogenase subunit E
MPSHIIPPDEPAPPPQETATCQMCHREVAKQYTAMVQGRLLCFGCIQGWLDYEEEEGDE